MLPEQYQIIGKYVVTDQVVGNRYIHLVTDNPREAIWEANKFPDRRTVENLRGDREFYKESGRWKQREID